MDLLPGETPKKKYEYLESLIERQNRIPPMKRDFQCKIQMKDWMWDSFNDAELNHLDKFEEKINEQLLEAFNNYLKHFEGSIKITTI